MQKAKPKGTYNLAKMRSVVAGYADFAGTKKDYCARLDLNVHTFDYWRKRVRAAESPTERKNPALPASQKFVELPPPPPLPATDFGTVRAVYTLHLPDGKRLDLPLCTPPAVLTHLLQISL